MKIKSIEKLGFFKLTLAILVVGLFTACSSDTENQQSDASDESMDTEMETAEVAPNTLTPEEEEQGFMLLFDGETSEGWRGYQTEEFPGAWEIADGALHIQGSGRGEAGAEDGGDILYDEVFSNFHLKFEWKVSEGGNSGVFYLGQETDEFDYIWMTAPEFQILDNERHPDAMLGENGNRQSASLYDIYPAEPQNANPAGEWNTSEIIVYDGTVVHRQNGEAVVEYHLWTPKWEEDVADSKFPELNENWVDVAEEGYIGLQDHGDDVWFRSIKLRRMD
ncbi:3-keto-disaccharide hydrolase [Rhodohalobacter sulfatireducens]|uniref:DUF1080 domain-containing protein n=1 Tax=Rhodohalobacter sulfatireducens TaxID=2911366 RepID=A0ABS9KA25_9BACT|nr:DUF1080 domain-containing protein [Rhodohalobacter sulfatireducens]MCG2587700.1 DUF1080 domain-containing protein [Rhodohalobacter sulfatireducens]MDR9367018.1 DUF1080 domain-containing protein [Balneolaceae bacterium]MDR9409699.1 DUF1080 domain-containing protein [Balneolaceae bacterium]